MASADKHAQLVAQTLAQLRRPGVASASRLALDHIQTGVFVESADPGVDRPRSLVLIVRRALSPPRAATIAVTTSRLITGA